MNPQPQSAAEIIEVPAGLSEADPFGAEAKCEAARRIRLEKACIPWRFAEADFASFECPTPEHGEMRDIVQRYAQRALTIDGRRGQNGLLLTGPAGSGKTHLAIAALRQIVQGGENFKRIGLYLSLPDLLARIRESYGDKEAASEGQLLGDAIQTRLVVLDDVGADRVTDWALEKLYLILNARYERATPTILTTNLNYPGEFEAWVGERLASRAYEMCLVVEGPRLDWRRRTQGGG